MWCQSVNNVKVLARMTGYMDCLMKEAVGIQMYPNNLTKIPPIVYGIQLPPACLREVGPS